MPKKSKASDNYFRWKFGKGEIEASGLGLIPAFLLVLLIIIMLGVGGGAFRNGVATVIEWAKADQESVERPPP